MAAATLAAGILLAGPGVANAAVTPGWEPDASALGAVTLYDASGKVITGGSLTASPSVAYAAASGPGRSGDTKAALFMYLPVQGVPPANWSGDSLTASTSFPNAAAPAPVKNLTVPVASGANGDLTIADVMDEFPNTSTAAGWQGLYELRLYSVPAGLGSGTYYRVDIQVDKTAGTWSVVYPAGPATTTTSLSAGPASPQPTGTAVTLTASVNPAAAGSVEFFDGTTSVGTGSYSASTGVATLSVTPSAGSHSYTAKFTPADTGAFQASTSSAMAYTITSPATPTGTTLTVTPPSGSAGDASGNLTVSLKAAVTPTGLDGSVHFFDGATDLGAADTYTKSTGIAVKSVVLNGALHYLNATFTPTDAAYAKSTSATVTYEIKPQNFGTAQITLQAPNNTPPYAGNLTLQVTSGTTANLTQVDPSTDAGHPAQASDPTGHRHAWVFTGNLTGVSVQDTRPTEPGWTLTGQTTSFANGAVTVPASHLGWTPAYKKTEGDAEGTVVAGPTVTSALAKDGGTGLSGPAKLGSAAAGSGLGTAYFTSGLELRIPDTSPTGTYTSTLTLTLVSP